MHLINSVKTRSVSRKNYSPATFEIKRNSDGRLVRVPMDNNPIDGRAEDFSLQSQFRTGVKFEAPAVFNRPSALSAVDAAFDAAETLDNEPTPELTPEPTPEPTPELTPEPTA